MYKYMEQLWNHIQYKILAGLAAAVFTDDFFKLLLIFVCLEILDIFSRWLALSKKCFKAIFPQTECNLWKAFTFMWQARKWRYIRSTGLRDGFCDKMLLYLLLLLVAAFADAALVIGKLPRLLSAVVITALSTTEALSILENLSECNDMVKQIKQNFEKVANKEK